MALPILDDLQLTVRSAARDEIVYLSSDPERARSPVTPARLADAGLVLSEATWGERDYTRQQLTRAVQTAHRTLRPHIEVENVETALEIAARGHADTIAARGVVHRLAGQLPHRLHSAPLRPRPYDHFAIVHRCNTTLGRATRTLIDLATTRLRQATARGRQADP
ncbi:MULTISPECIES: LysR family transcriptional regulator substrate-binding protein [unclassified Streptomyces]|uniref:LysR family transcriptional regulator substrate-binding protein n=1 Tax=unclassified Streptomyces TaxID=2593676 RepID=UPI000AB146D1|nr:MULTISPECIES: LysR family transcriptional regulator substrate-binding protein [unclassified Streptomyces]MCP3769276.1 LysR family transcriptional regulator substrate-binding protein [Streptomyces sp. MAR25Y5]